MSRPAVVLVVDDDDALAEELHEIISALGLGFLRASTQEEALAALADRAFDLVLLDLQIKLNEDSIKPRVESGFTVLRTYRRALPGRTPIAPGEVPIIAMSGHATDNGYVMEAMMLGASFFLQKPFDARDVRRVVEDALARAYPDADTSPTPTPPPTSTTRSTPVPPPMPAPAHVVLEVPGRSTKGRTSFVVGGEPLDLPAGDAEVLLWLVGGRAASPEGWVHKADFGDNREQALQKSVSRIRERMRAFVGGREAVENDRSGSYRLVPEIVLGHIDGDFLRRHSNKRVRQVAAVIDKPKKKSA